MQNAQKEFYLTEPRTLKFSFHTRQRWPKLWLHALHYIGCKVLGMPQHGIELNFWCYYFSINTEHLSQYTVTKW